MKPRYVKFSRVIEGPVKPIVDAYKFVSVCGIEKCLRILDRAPTQEPRKAKSYSDKTGSYYGDHNNHSVCLEKLKEAVEDFKLVAEYKLPDGFWGSDSIDVFGLEGTSLYLEAYAFYSNDEEKAVLDRLQLALDRITKGLESSNSQALNHSCLSDLSENESQSDLPIKQVSQSISKAENLENGTDSKCGKFFVTSQVKNSYVLHIKKG
ncbi:hypothetical protein [Acinetobacter soli]|uniref:hypothetical protein n=1 Tax=Acinetobacter soli TaxID=487316 RepID=UPI001250BC0F|nr:hypothetical protein [Acinetobacter soli]